jgi:hypothetical protein
MSHEPSSSAPAAAHRRAALTHVPDIARPAADLHATARIVDLHIHPGMTVALFRRDLTRMYWAKRGTSAISVRANFQSLHAGNVRVSLSVAHVPEKGLCDDFRIPRVLPAQLPRLTQRLIVDGYREDEVLAILGGNALRALRQGWLPPTTPRPILAPEDIDP